MSKRETIKSIEASQWWVTLRDEDCTEHERAQFVDWLRAAPENIAEYLKLANVWRDLGDVVPDASIDEILAELSNDNVLQYPGIGEIEDGKKTSPDKNWRKSWLAIAASVVIIGAASLFTLQQPENTIETAIGEQRTVVLEDGTVLKLNTRTRLHYEIDAASRHVVLMEGEALFDVARDVNRPFTVTVGQTTVRVLGTSFNIYKTSDTESTITVLRGLVEVKPGTTQSTLPTRTSLPVVSQDIKLTVGEQLHVSNEEAVVPEKVPSTEKTIEWTSRRISFENTPLKDVIFEFNRYNTRQLQVEDAELAMLRLNGVFEADGQEALLDYLKKTANIHVRDVGNRRVITR